MKFTTQEVLDQIFGGGGAQFGANENMMLQVGDSRVRHDSGRGDSSVEGSLSSVSEGGSITDSINRLHIQKSLSIEDDVFQMGKYCRFGNFRENFFFANSIKRHISEVKNSRLRQDLPISIND